MFSPTRGGTFSSHRTHVELAGSLNYFDLKTIESPTQSVMSTTTATEVGVPTKLRKNVSTKQQRDNSNPDDIFFWTYTEEPHRTRRQAVIKAHREVLQLCGPEPLTIPLVTAVVLLQVFCAYMLKDTPILSLRFFLTAYIIGATANQNLFLAIHEISHNLAFKEGWKNRMFAIIANVPNGEPYSASFRP